MFAFSNYLPPTAEKNFRRSHSLGSHYLIYPFNYLKSLNYQHSKNTTHQNGNNNELGNAQLLPQLNHFLNFIFISQ